MVAETEQETETGEVQTRRRMKLSPNAAAILDALVAERKIERTEGETVSAIIEAYQRNLVNDERHEKMLERMMAALEASVAAAVLWQKRAEKLDGEVRFIHAFLADLTRNMLESGQLPEEFEPREVDDAVYSKADATVEDVMINWSAKYGDDLPVNQLIGG